MVLTQEAGARDHGLMATKLVALAYQLDGLILEGLLGQIGLVCELVDVDLTVYASAGKEAPFDGVDANSGHETLTYLTLFFQHHLPIDVPQPQGTLLIHSEEVVLPFRGHTHLGLVHWHGLFFFSLWWSSIFFDFHLAIGSVEPGHLLTAHHLKIDWPNLLQIELAILNQLLSSVFH